jgi:multiple sugar transport system substrate-binding protein
MTRTRSKFSRRSVVKGGVSLGVATPLISSMVLRTAAAPQQSSHRAMMAQSDPLSFYNDKSNWQDFIAEMSNLAQEQVGIGLESVPYSDTTSFQQVINSSIQSSDAPDLFTWWTGYRLEDMYKSGAVLDVTDIWTDAVEAGDLPDTLSAAFTFEDKQWGVARDASYWPVWYNKRVFADNGLEVPTTWDEFLAACETLKGADVAPLYATIDGRWPSFIWFEEMIIRNDPDFYVELCNGRAKYTDDVAVKAMEDWRNLFDNEYFAAVDIPMDSNLANMFVNGEIAMVPAGTWFQQQWIDVGMVPGEDFDAFILPNINPDLTEKVMIIETGALVIPSQGDRVEDCKTVARWWDTTDAQALWSSSLGDTPANPQVELENPVLNGLVSMVADEGYRLMQRYWEASPPQIVENAVDELSRFMLNPDQGQSVLESIEAIAAEEWARREEGN